MVNVYFHQYIHNNIQFKRRCRYEYEYLLLQCEPSAFNNIRSRVIPWSAGQLSYLRQVPEVPGFPRSAPQIRQVAGGEKRSEMEALPLQEKTEMTKTDISAGGELSNDKFRGCLFTLTLIKGIADANINSSLLKSLTAESTEKKQDK